MEYQYLADGTQRIFEHGVVYLEIGLLSFPIHRDMMFEYPFFRNLPPDMITISDPKCITPDGLDILLCLAYSNRWNNQDFPEDLFSQRSALAHALIAWDYFGGPHRIGDELVRLLWNVIPTHSYDPMLISDFPEGLEDLLIRSSHRSIPDTYARCRSRIAQFRAVQTIDGRERLAAHFALEARDNDACPRPPESMTVKQLQSELETKKRASKTDLIRHVCRQRIETAVLAINKACLASPEERRALEHDMRRLHPPENEIDRFSGIQELLRRDAPFPLDGTKCLEPTSDMRFTLFPDGSLWDGRVDVYRPVVPGPWHTRKYFLYRDDAGFCIAVSERLHTLVALRDRMMAVFFTT